MMTQELNVCVLTAPLAAIDRRALSQAWYSALHCHSGTSSDSVPTPKGKRLALASNGGATPAAQRERQRAEFINEGHKKVAKDRKRWSVAVAGNDRRARRSPLAQRIERKCLDPGFGLRRATFSSGGKRVHVMVQASQGRVRLVAVCAPSLRKKVAQALAQARFALASRGVACF